jgi:aspartyl-tRNA(Asn)/glutamyl-tRNA(Gln) amidotransferase subunit C
MTHPTDTTLLELAELARLDVAGLGEVERAGLREALARTTEWVGQLMGVPTDGVPPTVQPVVLPTVLRADVAVPNADAGAMLAVAPDREGDWYRVPRVVGRAMAVEPALASETGVDAAVGLEHGDE